MKVMEGFVDDYSAFECIARSGELDPPCSLLLSYIGRRVKRKKKRKTSP
jgi:hypothetical protein